MAKNLKGFRGVNSEQAQSDYDSARKKYGNLSEDALINELKRQIEKSKADGTYSSEKTMEYVSTITPYLSPRQKSRLDEILELLK